MDGVLQDSEYVFGVRGVISISEKGVLWPRPKNRPMASRRNTFLMMGGRGRGGRDND